MPGDYMTADQRFASTRPDVLVYQTAPLENDITIAGPIAPSLRVSTTGTDSDFVVKLIDVYPGDYPDPDPNPTHIVMGGYQQLVRGEPFRGKFRKSMSKPEPFTPGKPETIEFTHARCLPHLPRGTSHHGADPEQLVPADRSQSASLHRHPQGQVDGLQEGHRARLSRFRAECLGDRIENIFAVGGTMPA